MGLHYVVDCGNMTGGGTSVQAVSDQTFKRIERETKKLKFLKNLKIKRRLLRAMVSAKVKWAATWQSLGKREYEVTRMVEKVVAKYTFESPTLRWWSKHTLGLNVSDEETILGRVRRLRKGARKEMQGILQGEAINGEIIVADTR